MFFHITFCTMHSQLLVTNSYLAIRFYLNVLAGDLARFQLESMPLCTIIRESVLDVDSNKHFSVI